MFSKTGSSARARRLWPAAVLLALPLSAAAQQAGARQCQAQLQPAGTCPPPPVRHRRPPPRRRRCRCRRRCPYSIAPTRSCPRGCACAASSASASKASTTSASPRRAMTNYALTRVRVNATITPSQSLSFQVNVQDARVAGKTVGPTTAPVPRPVRPARRLCRRRLRQGAGGRAARAPGARVRRAAAARPPRLGEHRPHVGRGAGHPPPQGVPGGRVRRLAGAQPARRVRQERQRQPAGRRLRHHDQADAQGHGRAVRRSTGAT